jgi:uncharacterized membrane protein
MTNPRSTASIAGHPIHPMLVAFPIAFFVATLACDITFWRSCDAYWATTAQWVLGAGLVMAALTAVAGAIDVLGEPRIRALRDVGIILVTGWNGWQMVYRHHVGVSDEQDVPYREPRRTT